MNTTSVFNSLRNASSLLRVANNELCRPSEDAVTLCACRCTRDAVMKFLHSYLIEKKVPVTSGNSLQTLLSLCCKVDSGFNSIDISCFACKTSDNDCTVEYCLDVKKVNECFEWAKVIEEFVLAKLKIHPRDIESL